MKTGFILCGKLHRDNPVLALYWPCTGLQWWIYYPAMFFSSFLALKWSKMLIKFWFQNSPDCILAQFLTFNFYQFLTESFFFILTRKENRKGSTLYFHGLSWSDSIKKLVEETFNEKKLCPHSHECPLRHWAYGLRKLLDSKYYEKLFIKWTHCVSALDCL